MARDQTGTAFVGRNVYPSMKVWRMQIAALGSGNTIYHIEKPSKPLAPAADALKTRAGVLAAKAGEMAARETQALNATVNGLGQTVGRFIDTSA